MKATSTKAYRLLIIDGHKSYYLIEFQDYYKENKIITLYILLYLSHLLQPLNVILYSLLKRYYSDGISLLARSRIYYINKETFLLAFKVAFEKTFTLENIRAGFRGAGLVPHNPKVVLLKLDIQLRTLTLPILGTIA
jgi:hypothetical protein